MNFQLIDTTIFFLIFNFHTKFEMRLIYIISPILIIKVRDITDKCVHGRPTLPTDQGTDSPIKT